jgi:hypothetical protein
MLQFRAVLLLYFVEGFFCLFAPFFQTSHMTKAAAFI